MKPRFVGIVSCISAIVIVTAPSLKPKSEAFVLTGSVAVCKQQELYGTEEVRSGSFWQFRSSDYLITDTYFIESYLGTPICSRVLQDKARGAVYFQEGDKLSFSRAEAYSTDLACLKAFNNLSSGDQPPSKPPNPPVIELQIVTTDMRVNVVYPTGLLLAPAYMGDFPRLADVLVSPSSQDLHGFSFEVGIKDLMQVRDIDLTGEAFTDKNVLEIVQFYLSQLPEWQLASVDKTVFPQNPYILIPGARDVYFSLANATTQNMLDFHFFIDKKTHSLIGDVAVHPNAQKSDSHPAIEGSSQSIAQKASLFVGWSSAESGPTKTFQGGAIESYALRRGAQYWFLDLKITGTMYKVLYSKTVTQQTPCQPDAFLPSWVSPK